MVNNDNNAMRRICPEDGTGCWHDEGWRLPGGGEGSVLPGVILPTYYDTNGNLYIVVGANQGGTFSGSAIGTCLPFTSNTTNVIMMPKHLVQ